ncbi:MAG: acyl carrier protein [Anaerolineales bacterium]
MQEMLTDLSQYIANHILKTPQRTIQADEPLISSGILDSFHLIDLALYIEDRFCVKIEDTELNRQTFDNLLQLCELILSKTTH